MKNRLFTLTVILCLVAALALPACASPDYLVDDAQLLSRAEAAEVEAKLAEISARQGVDVVIVTVDSLGGKSPMAYADDFYDYNGYSADGVLLLVSMEDNDWWISTKGYGITAFTDAGIEYLGDQFVPSLSDEDYTGAFNTFADSCDEFITQAKSGSPYDTHNLPKEPFNFLKNLIICFVIGLVIAAIATAIMKGKLKTVHAKAGAADYMKRGSLNVTQRQDLFLYRDVKRTAKPKSSSGSSTHTSSSGSSHGGGGGKF